MKDRVARNIINMREEKGIMRNCLSFNQGKKTEKCLSSPPFLYLILFVSCLFTLNYIYATHYWSDWGGRSNKENKPVGLTPITTSRPTP